MYELKKVIMRRDNLTSQEAEDAINEAAMMVIEGVDPEMVLESEFGLEPDYVFDLLDAATKL